MRLRRRTSLLALLTALLVLAGLATAPTSPAAVPATAGGPRYIVTLRDGVDADAVAAEYHHGKGSEVSYVYHHALNGFTATMSDPALRALRGDGRVDRIERDAEVTIDAAASWGLDRIDQVSLPLDQSYSPSGTGAGVTAYIIDTGISAGNTDFGGRANAAGYSAIADGRGTDDCNGHGTHVSGTVGGATYGVAKAVQLVPVRVLDCSGSGSWSGVIAGVDWVTADHAALVAANGTAPAVANMSLGGGAITSVDDAVRRSINGGVTYAIAAGNNNGLNACNYSPARVAEALTVGATTSTDARASYSNVGTCLDLFAPGSSITSDWIGSPSATNTISGTSMATPHVTGAAALYLGANPASTPAQVSGAITSGATAGKVTSPGSGSPDRLLHVLTAASSTPPGEPATPIANIAATCSNANCTFTGSSSITPATYAWTVDGADRSGNPVSATFAAGDHVVTLTAAANGKTSAVATKNVSCSNGKNRKLTCKAS